VLNGVDLSSGPGILWLLTGIFKANSVQYTIVPSSFDQLDWLTELGRASPGGACSKGPGIPQALSGGSCWWFGVLIMLSVCCRPGDCSPVFNLPVYPPLPCRGRLAIAHLVGKAAYQAGECVEHSRKPANRHSDHKSAHQPEPLLTRLHIVQGLFAKTLQRSRSPLLYG